MILEDIKTKLEELDANVFYGMADKSKVTAGWNYIVFMRRVMKSSTNKTGYSDHFIVAIIRENFIPEGYDVEVIDKMAEIGLRLASADAQYNYTINPNTNTVVEIETIEFVKSRKRCE